MGIISILMVEALAISLRYGNSTFAPSGWFMHAWSHTVAVEEFHYRRSGVNRTCSLCSL